MTHSVEEPLYYVRDFTGGIAYGLGETNGLQSDSCADGGENRTGAAIEMPRSSHLPATPRGDCRMEPS